jgi:prolyl oligopeptidase
VRDTPESEARIALPAKALGPGRLQWWQPSPDGLLLAYGVLAPGGDVELRVRDVESALDLPDRISRAPGGLAWASGRIGFYYVRGPDPRADPAAAAPRTRVLWHQLGQAPVDDEPVYEAKPDASRWELQASRDGAWLLLTIWTGPQRSEVFIQDRRSAGAPWVGLKTGQNAAYRGLFHDRTLYLLTDEAAPRGRILAADLRRLDRIRWRQILAESRFPAADFALTKGALVLTVLERGISRMQLYDLKGRPRGEASLPGPGRVAALAGDPRQEELLFIWESLADPPALYRHNTRTAVRARVDAGPWDNDEYEQKYVEFKSGAGASAGMFLLTSPWLKQDGERPTVIAAAAGGEPSPPPAFSAQAAAWVRQGGVWAAVLPRTSTPAAPAAITDLMAAGYWLTDHEYTKPGRLAVLGAGAGAGLAAQAAAGAPTLFKSLVLIQPEAGLSLRLKLPATLLLSGPCPDVYAAMPGLQLASAKAHYEEPFWLRWEPLGCTALPPDKAASELLDIQSFLLWNLEAETPDTPQPSGNKPLAPRP